ncbi:MAG: VOC family protein [Caulobacteraceae bacterium]|nr:VOC family protein [Caulobacteraceae bacterium]
MTSAKLSLDIGIVTGDAPPMLAFYGNVLEIPCVGEVTLPGLGVLRKFQYGASVIKILAPFDPPQPAPRTQRFSQAAGLRYLTLMVADLAQTFERCREAGAKVLVEITPVRPGVTAAMVEDPDGNAVELMQVG